jgi:DNA-binding NarL/FixJ family response regulator
VPIRVLLGDDHTLVREGLRRYIESTDGIEVLGEASTGAEMVALARETEPDLVVLDIRMPEMDGIEAARRINEQVPATRVVMLTAYDDRHFVVEAVRAGAKGYVLKTKDAEHLLQAVRLVHDGHMVIDPELVVALADEMTVAKDRDVGAETLTEREVEVLQLLAFGYTNRDIAGRLFISPDTVKTHLEHIYHKIGANDRTAAVAEAMRRRLIE